VEADRIWKPTVQKRTIKKEGSGPRHQEKASWGIEASNTASGDESHRCDLRGLTVEEALDRTARLLDKAVLPHCRDTGLPMALMFGVKRQVNPGLPANLSGDAMTAVAPFRQGTVIHRITAVRSPTNGERPRRASAFLQPNRRRVRLS